MKGPQTCEHINQTQAIGSVILREDGTWESQQEMLNSNLRLHLPARVTWGWMRKFSVAHRQDTDHHFLTSTMTRNALRDAPYSSKQIFLVLGGFLFLRERNSQLNTSRLARQTDKGKRRLLLPTSSSSSQMLRLGFPPVNPSSAS